MSNIINYNEKDFLNYNWTINNELSTWEKLKNFLFPGCVFVDIGCQKGIYSKEVISYLKGNCHIIAIDALEHPEIRKVLRETDLFINKVIGDGKTSKNVWYRCDGNNKSFTASSSFCLDDLKLNKVDFIKIDVDGWGLEVLSGAEETISKQNKLVIIIEDIPNSQYYDNSVNFLVSKNFKILGKFDDNVILIKE